MFDTKVDLEKIKNNKNTLTVLTKIGKALNCARTDMARLRLYAAAVYIAYEDACSRGACMPPNK